MEIFFAVGGLVLAAFYWRLSYKYALLGFLLGLITFSGIFFIIRVAISMNLLPQNLPSPSMENFSYLPGFYFGITYALLAAVGGTFIELAINKIKQQNKTKK